MKFKISAGESRAKAPVFDQIKHKSYKHIADNDIYIYALSR